MKVIFGALLVPILVGSAAFGWGGFVGDVVRKDNNQPAENAIVEVWYSNEDGDCLGHLGDWKAGPTGHFDTGHDMDEGYYWLHPYKYYGDTLYEGYKWDYFPGDTWEYIGIIYIYKDCPCPW